MQLRLSVAAAAVISAIASQAEDYVSVQFLQYDENNNRTSVSAPSIMVNKDFGTDYTLNISGVADAVSGASPTYYDSASGASAFSRGIGVNASDVKYGNIEYSDQRLAGSLLFTMRFANRDELIIGANYSAENDFYSTEGSAEYMHWLDSSKNRSISLGLSYQANEILVECVENSACDSSSGASEAMTADVINAQVSFFQNIDAQSYAKASLFYVSESGFLSNPYLNVVRNNNGVTADVVAEARPDSKQAYGLALKYANALSSNISLHLAYRYYSDDWEINSHTLDTDLYYEAGSKWLFKIGLRGYTQSEASFYNGSDAYFTNEQYVSSDERLSAFNAVTYKINVEYQMTEDLRFNLGANYYDQSTGLSATYFMTGFTYNF
ncbi:MAG: DUF3570 domain-containing protein [Sulfurimonadaceae bacterium]